MGLVHTLVSLPLAIWTVAIGVLAIYWLLALVGLIDLDGADSAPDAAIGAAKGAFEGAGKAAAEVLADGLSGAGGEAASGLDAEGVSEAADGLGTDNSTALLGGLRAKDVPITITLSAVVFFAWAISLLALEFFGQAWSPLVRWLVTMGLAPLVSLPLSSLVARPLSRVFGLKKAQSHRELIGRTCRVRTGEVTATFGEVLLQEHGADVILRVRAEEGTHLRRGDEGVIVGFDAERNEYIVEALEIESAQVARK
jgi:membrane protein implicated in regulation of membrane protease activity